MKNLLSKEIRLAANPLSFFFILFGIMALIPGYPILVGAFFTTLGIFQSFQSSRENNDILYTVLLPVKKTDAVKAKFVFCIFIELAAFLLSFILTVIRMTVLKNAAPYVNNAMMNANQIYLSWLLVIFALFNLVFVCRFFKTAYYLGKGFITYIVICFVVIGIAETIHHIPGLKVINSTDTMGNALFWIILLCAISVYAVITHLACKKAAVYFESVDM